MPFPREQIPVSVVIGITIIVVAAKDALVADARWWNLVMAGLLVVVLVLHLIRDHHRRN